MNFNSEDDHNLGDKRIKFTIKERIVPGSMMGVIPFISEAIAQLSSLPSFDEDPFSSAESLEYPNFHWSDYGQNDSPSLITNEERDASLPTILSLGEGFQPEGNLKTPFIAPAELSSLAVEKEEYLPTGEATELTNQVQSIFSGELFQVAIDSTEAKTSIDQTESTAPKEVDPVNNFGMTDVPSINEETTINREPPQADLKTDLEGLTDQPHLLDASNSFDLDGEIVKYTFDFGDGTSYTESTSSAPDGIFDGRVLHTYTEGGEYQVSVIAFDDDNNSDTASQRIIINAPPEATDDYITVSEDKSIIISPLDNDIDPDGDQLVIGSYNQASHGTVTYNVDNTFTYTPEASFYGNDSFTYLIDDGKGGLDSATIYLSVTPINDEPTAIDDSYITNEDTTLTIKADLGVLVNDSDPDGDGLMVSSFTQANNGTILLNLDGSFTYTPNANFSGNDSFNYTISDGNGGTNTATVNLTVNPTNDDPVALDDTYITEEDSVLTVDAASGVLNNDNDPEGDSLSIDSFVQPSNGSVSLNPDGSFTYTPNADFSGSDSFSYVVTDGRGGNASANVTISINPTDDSPIAIDDTITILGDQELVLSTEFQINTFTDNDQNNQQIVPLADGGFVVVWESEGQDGSEEGIFGQRFDDSGNKLGTEFQMNTATDGRQVNPQITALADGGFVVVYESRKEEFVGYTGYNGYYYGYYVQENEIYGQKFDQFGTKIGAEFQVNSYTTNDQEEMQIAALQDGGFVVVWESSWQDGSGEGIYGQRFDAAGGKIGAEFQVNTYTNNHQDNPLVTSLDDGGFVVVWESFGQDRSNTHGIYGQKFDALGNSVNGEFQVNTFTTSDQDIPQVVSLEGGGFVVVWESFGQDSSGNAIYGQVFDASGNNLGVEFPIHSFLNNDQNKPQITTLSDGGFVVIWDSFGQDGSDSGIFGQKFDASGNRVGFELSINSFTQGSQNDPQVTALQDGGFVVVWESASQDGSGNGVYGQKFDGAGNRSGDEFQVNTFTENTQGDAKLTTLNDGKFVVTWVSATQDDSGFGVYGQVFNQDGTPNLTADTRETTFITNFNPVTLDVLANDLEPDGDPLYIVDFETSSALGGTVELDNAGNFKYTPPAEQNVVAQDSFSYTIVDQLIEGDLFAGNSDLTLLSYTSTTTEGSTVRINQAGQFTYIPAANLDLTQINTDSFSYTVLDTFSTAITQTHAIDLSGITTVSSTATVNINLELLNAVEDNITTDEDIPVNIEVLANDTDPNGGSLMVSGITTNPRHGNLVINADNTITYTPNSNFSGNDIFVYSVQTPEGGSDQAVVNITINPINDPPIASDDDYFLIAGGTELNIEVGSGVVVNDLDLDGDTITVDSFTQPSHGAVTLQSNGSFTYTPNLGFTGNDSFIYTISDGNGNTDTATVNILVDPSNTQPTAIDDSYSTSATTTLTLNLLDNDSDPQGDPLTISAINDQEGNSITLPSGAIVTVNNDGTVEYDPNGQYVDLPIGQTAIDTFTYTISDGRGGFDTALATVNIQQICASEAHSDFFAFDVAGSGVSDIAVVTGHTSTFTNVGTTGDGTSIDLRISIVGQSAPQMFFAILEGSSGGVDFLMGADTGNFPGTSPLGETGTLEFAFFESGTNNPIALTTFTTINDIEILNGGPEGVFLDSNVVGNYAQTNPSRIIVNNDGNTISALGATGELGSDALLDPEKAFGFSVPSQSSFQATFLARGGLTGFTFNFDSEDFWC